MGKIKYLTDIENFIDKNKVFCIKDIQRFLMSKKANPKYAYLLLHNMAKKRKINRVIKGYYTKYDDPMLIAYCIKPSYVGLESALSLYGMWEQESNVVLVTPRRVRYGVRNVFKTNVVIRPIAKEYFFGYDYVDYYDLKIPVSDIEKTFIDLVFYKSYIDKNLLRIFKRKMNTEKLKEYLKHYNKRFIDRVERILGV